jgi:tRNA(Ile)-lysidine synthetase-like protein
MLITDVPSGRVLVAVSGGPDSTALLIALHVAGRDIVAAHYDHALREGSDGVARDVAGLCRRLGVELVSERRAEPLPKGSLQAAARTLRYDFLERARVSAGAEWIVTAHSADDLVEGVVLHLLRGCGLAGVRGMPVRRGRFVRPMLQTWRKDVSAFLAERGLVTHQDPANRDERFARVRARLHILPALERDSPGITRRFHGAAMTASRLQQEAETTPTQAEALKKLYADAGGPQPGLSRRHIEAMSSLSRPGRGGRGVDLPGALRFRIVGGLMQVIPSRPVLQAPVRLEVTACAGCDDDQAVHLRQGVALHVGHRRPGLRMRPLGGRGSRKLQDIFVDARVPREERDSWPLVFAGDKLAWVPGVAVDADLVSTGGQLAQHVAVRPMPARPAPKVVRLKPRQENLS